VDGVEITGLSDSKLVPVRRKSVGFVFQSFNLWESLTARENVELPLNMAGMSGRAARERATQLLKERGLGNRLGFRSRDLSGGEKQRVSIARALANEPRLLLADEPTANLDSEHGREIMALLREIARSGGPSEAAGADRAVVVVSHDQRIREVADRVLWLEDGRIRDIGHMVRDPVCGMGVEVDRAVAVVHDGRTLHFCSLGCSREFAASPQRFLAGAGEGRV
jgi:putative ABC transport system ATP-binding protein